MRREARKEDDNNIKKTKKQSVIHLVCTWNCCNQPKHGVLLSPISRMSWQCSDLFWTRVWRIPGFGAENKSALSKVFCLLLQFWGFKGCWNSRQTQYWLIAWIPLLPRWDGFRAIWVLKTFLRQIAIRYRPNSGSNTFRLVFIAFVQFAFPDVLAFASLSLVLVFHHSSSLSFPELTPAIYRTHGDFTLTLSAPIPVWNLNWSGNHLDGGNSAFSNRVLVETNFDASKTLFF